MEFTAPQHYYITFSVPKGAEVLIDLGNKIEIEVIFAVEYHTLQFQFFRSRKGCVEEITILYKICLKVFEVEKSEFVLSFSKYIKCSSVKNCLLFQHINDHRFKKVNKNTVTHCKSPLFKQLRYSISG